MPVLIRKIEEFLRRSGMAATKFGRLATHDPRFVLDLRNGRTPRPETAKRVEHFMNEYTGANHAF
ncbi:MAG: hypothetical protein RLZZ08_1907 [Pseudomonadota bacterium]